MNAADIVAYQYAADLFHPECIIENIIARGYASPGAREMEVEEALDQIADANTIDRADELSFDSSDFPKVCSLDELNHDGSGETCGGCLEWIVEPLPQQDVDPRVLADLEELRKAVDAGAEVLTKAKGEKWACLIDLNDLDLSSPWYCVLGQVYRHNKDHCWSSGYALAVDGGQLTEDYVDATGEDFRLRTIDLGFNAGPALLGSDWVWRQLNRLWTAKIEDIRARVDCGGDPVDGEGSATE